MTARPAIHGPAPAARPVRGPAAVRGAGPGGHGATTRAGLISRVTIWWREVDRVLLALILVLVAIGLIAVAAASPASAQRLSTADQALSNLYFFWPHLAFVVTGLATMVGVSFLSRENARRMGIVLACAMLFALMLVPVVGHEVNGARRWLRFGIGIQPSEFYKPGFAILLSWVLSWRLRDPNIPVFGVAVGLMALTGLLLMAQPNLGEAILCVGAWMVVVTLSGVPLRRIGALIGCGVAALVAAYLFYGNARNRIDNFLFGGTAYDQVDLAQRTLLGGGWSGAGFWLGLNKMRLPEAHTDYIFSVIGEEFGLMICLVVVAIYLAIVVRVLLRLAEEEDLFALLASAGLVTLFGGQAFINILVNLHLFPSKGMTLPLVSYGGSSTIAVCLSLGLLLALTKRNPFLSREATGLRAFFAGREDKR